MPYEHAPPLPKAALMQSNEGPQMWKIFSSIRKHFHMVCLILTCPLAIDLFIQIYTPLTHLLSDSFINSQPVPARSTIYLFFSILSAKPMIIYLCSLQTDSSSLLLTDINQQRQHLSCLQFNAYQAEKETQRTIELMAN